MEISQLLSFTIAAMLLVVSPGPNGLLIAKTVPSSGRVAGFANVAGFGLAFYLHGVLSILGISLILIQSAELFFLLKVAGAIYLCWIGVQSLRSACRETPFVQQARPVAKQTAIKKAFIEGVLTCGLNPKVSMFYLAVFPQFIPQTGETVGVAFQLVFIHSTLNLIWFSSMVILFSRLSGALHSSRIQRWVKAVTGFVFIGFGAKLASLDRLASIE